MVNADKIVENIKQDQAMKREEQRLANMTSEELEKEKQLNTILEETMDKYSEALKNLKDK